MRRILLLLLAITPAIAFAQGFQVNTAGQQQIGMGHTGTGLAQDGASIFFNPGAVAMLPQNSIQAGMSPLFFRSAFNPDGSNTVYNNENKTATPFSAYAVWGPKSSFWKLGFGVYTPFGGLNNWGDNWEGKYALESLDLKAIYYQPTVSFKLADFLSVGGGFVFAHGTVDLTQAIPLANSAGQDGQAELKGAGKGYGWNAGIYLDTHEGFTMGVSYRSKVQTTIKSGDAIFTVPASVQAEFPQPNTFYASIPLPATASIGLGYRASQQWLFALDLNLVQWSVYKALAFDYANNSAQLQDTYSPRNYKNAFALRGGIEYQPVYMDGHMKKNENWVIRAGGGYAAAAAPDGYVTPDVPDANRYYLTVGAGLKLCQHLNLDASFEYEHLMSRDQTNIQTQLAGTFKSNVYIPGLSLTYHW